MFGISATYHWQGFIHIDIGPVAFAIVYIHNAIVIAIAGIGRNGRRSLHIGEHPTYLMLKKWDTITCNTKEIRLKYIVDKW